MKTCGYCGRTYDDSQPRCPSCGSTLLKHSHGTDSAAADYDRIKKEIEDKRKSRSKILIDWCCRCSGSGFGDYRR